MAKQILVIDKQDYWRVLSVRTLEAAGFAVVGISNYAYPFSLPDDWRIQPDLVILGCATIGPEEHKLIGHILANRHLLLVLSSALPWDTRRSIFLLGAADVDDKPYEPDYLIQTVETVLKDIEPRTAYEQAEREEQL